MATQGSCVCGDVKYEYKGSGFSSNVGVPRSEFQVVKGVTKTYDAVAASGKINKHHFCSNCGSSLFTELEALPDMTFIKAGSLDGGAASMGGHVDVEYFTKDRVSYLNGIESAKQERAF